MVKAVLIPEGGIPFVLDSRGTTLCNLDELLSRGASVIHSFVMQRATVVILEYEVILEYDPVVAARDVNFKTDADRNSRASNSPSESIK